MVAFEKRWVEGAGGVKLAVHHLGGDGPPLLAVHATGFHGRCWWPLAAELTPSFSVWALDQRGHGESDKDPTGTYDWELFAADLLAVVDALGGAGGAAPSPPGGAGRPRSEETWFAAGHSLGGAAILLAEAARPGTFSAAACYEPVVMPPDGMPIRRPNPLAELARKRRPSFPSREAALQNYRSKPPFNRFHPEALEMYVAGGFVDLPDGSVTLACTREDEAATFDAAWHAPVWQRLADVPAKVTVLAGAAGEDPLAHIAGEVADRLPAGTLRRFEHLDHFGPLTAPAEVGSAMASALRGA
jgi:pimeloyl-ACP methyl ester carboxylesterase